MVYSILFITLKIHHYLYFSLKLIKYKGDSYLFLFDQDFMMLQTVEMTEEIRIKMRRIVQILLPSQVFMSLPIYVIHHKMYQFS